MPSALLFKTVQEEDCDHMPKHVEHVMAEAIGEDDGDYLTTEQLAKWLAVSPGWLHVGRRKGYGPIYFLISPHKVRYRRADVVAWLRERVHKCTAEYTEAETA